MSSENLDSLLVELIKKGEILRNEVNKKIKENSLDLNCEIEKLKEFAYQLKLVAFKVKLGDCNSLEKLQSFLESDESQLLTEELEKNINLNKISKVNTWYVESIKNITSNPPRKWIEIPRGGDDWPGPR